MATTADGGRAYLDHSRAARRSHRSESERSCVARIARIPRGLANRPPPDERARRSCTTLLATPIPRKVGRRRTPARPPRRSSKRTRPSALEHFRHKHFCSSADLEVCNVRTDDEDDAAGDCNRILVTVGGCRHLLLRMRSRSRPRWRERDVVVNKTRAAFTTLPCAHYGSCPISADACGQKQRRNDHQRPRAGFTYNSRAPKAVSRPPASPTRPPFSSSSPGDVLLTVEGQQPVTASRGSIVNIMKTRASLRGDGAPERLVVGGQSRHYKMRTHCCPQPASAGLAARL